MKSIGTNISTNRLYVTLVDATVNSNADPVEVAQRLSVVLEIFGVIAMSHPIAVNAIHVASPPQVTYPADVQLVPETRMLSIRQTLTPMFHLTQR